MSPSNKHRTSKRDAYLKSDYNLTVVKSKCSYNKYKKYEKIKITGNSEIYKTIYHNSSYLLLLGKKKLQSFEISCE